MRQNGVSKNGVSKRGHLAYLALPAPPCGDRVCFALATLEPPLLDALPRLVCVALCLLPAVAARRLADDEAQQERRYGDVRRSSSRMCISAQ